MERFSTNLPKQGSLEINIINAYVILCHSTDTFNTLAFSWHFINKILYTFHYPFTEVAIKQRVLGGIENNNTNGNYLKTLSLGSS